ncbi:MAG: hypothetical protein K8S16_01515 [Bacteroidales bacterium]|nr:hypothetical protein [Bacteroidales bacterium]
MKELIYNIRAKLKQMAFKEEPGQSTKLQKSFNPPPTKKSRQKPAFLFYLFL